MLKYRQGFSLGQMGVDDGFKSKREEELRQGGSVRGQMRYLGFILFFVLPERMR